MSNISNIHSFAPFASTGAGKSVALSGQRLCVVRYRKTAKVGDAVRASVCASVPMVVYSDWIGQVEALAPFVTSMLKDTQDAIARDAYESGKDHVSTEMLSVESCISYLTQQAAGDRLTGEVIKEWFVSEMQDVLLLAFAEKMGISDTPSEAETKKLEQITNVYRDKFASLAGGRTMFDPATRAKLMRALELVDCTDGIGAKLSAKLTAMQNVNVEDMLGL